MLYRLKNTFYALRANRVFLIFVLLETSQLLGIVQSDFEDMAYEVFFSLIYTSFSLSSCFYGYGIVDLRKLGPRGKLLRGICGASMKLWQRLSFLMLLPWSLKVLQQIEQTASNCLLNEHLSDMELLSGLTILASQLTLFVATQLLTIRLHRRLKNALKLTQYRENYEIRNYAQAINNSFGFDMFEIPDLPN
ncbi:uncharacterized protein LOC111592544 [Drosophila hydei]|uniref:Uncharacterized protein LOC111592544 n=1 Tax=Drosophila hydei TaxID=7224 RepID=A0A6J1L6S7_DROHY|nr:uncharacterized protein LOC111592544 [Drosophila hydei]